MGDNNQPHSVFVFSLFAGRVLTEEEKGDGDKIHVWMCAPNFEF